MKKTSWISVVILSSLLLIGCSIGERGAPQPSQPVPEGQDAEIKAARDSLNKEDRALVEAQEFCAVTNKGRLGSMGVPYKVMVKDQPVFLCCKGCERRALADPDKTLAKVAELKKARAQTREK